MKKTTIFIVLALLCLNFWANGQDKKVTQRPQPPNAIKKEPKLHLQDTTFQLQEVQVSTGYQTLRKERATGSFVVVDSALLNRRVGANVLDRLDGLVSGLLFNRNLGNAATTNEAPIAIRGRSTIYANPNPLVVVDNFPFNGDINSLNPDDIENISILKDAAAASIWGALSGNGVIVITTKKGKFGKNTQINFNSSLLLGGRPNLWYAPRLSTANAVDIEEYLFNKGYYNARINSSTYPVLSPVVEVLLARRNSKITQADSAQLINHYKGLDTRQGLHDDFYRIALEQRYGLSIAGGTAGHSYYISGGFDKNWSNVARVGFNRISFNLNNRHKLLGNRLDLDYTVGFARNRNENNGMPTAGAPYPYINFRYANGLPQSMPYQYRKSYIDTLGGGQLLDWSYRPLEELALGSNVSTRNEYRFNGRLQYQILDGFYASLQYQYNTSSFKQDIHRTENSFYTRDYINQFTQYNPSSGTYTKRIPLGGILDQTLRDYQSHNARLQLNYDKSFAQINIINVIAGFEQRWINQYQSSDRLYGYDGETGISSFDYNTQYTLLPGNTNLNNIKMKSNYLNLIVGMLTLVATTKAVRGQGPIENLVKKDSLIMNHVFKDSLGNDVKLSDFKGKYLMLDLWYSGCSGCITVNEGLHRVHDELKDSNIVFLSISIDKQKEMWLASITPNTPPSKMNPWAGRYASRKGTICLYTGGTRSDNDFMREFTPERIYPRLYLVDDEGHLINEKPPRPDVNKEPLIKFILSKMEKRKGRQ